MEKQFNLEKDDFREFINDIAESVAEDGEIAIDGDEWKIYNKVEGKIPLRIYATEDEVEIGFKLNN